MRPAFSTRLGSLRIHGPAACLLLLASAATSAHGGIRADVKAWLLANNPGLSWNFLKTDLPQRKIKLPDGRTVPLYKIKQFHDVNFRLRFSARRKEGMKIVNTMEARLKKLMALPEFYHWIKSYRSRYKIKGKKVSSQKAYNYFRNLNRRLWVTANKRYRAPVGGGNGMGAPSWAVWRQMNIFFHEACHCIGIGHNSGGLSGPLAGKLRRWDRQKRWKYQTIDLNTLTVPAPLAAVPRAAPLGSVSATSIQANWAANGNPSGTTYLVECWEGPDCTGSKVGDSGWTATPRFDFTGLAPNTQYIFRVQARNRDGVTTAWAELTSSGAYTRAAVPGAIALDTQVLDAGELRLNAPACRSVGVLGIDLHGNPADTLIAIQCTWTEGGQHHAAWLRTVDNRGRIDLYPDADAEHWLTAAQWAHKRLRGLRPGTNYQFTAKARNAAREQTALVDVDGDGGYDTLIDGNVADAPPSPPAQSVTALDYAWVREAILKGGVVGKDIPWATDVTDDGATTVLDLTWVRWAALRQR